VRALLDDPPALEHRDAVRPATVDSRCAMTSAVRSLSAWPSARVTSRIALRVEVARRLVQQQHRRAREQRPGQREALLLAPGELRARSPIAVS
jgi:hypothetical protein